MELWNKIVNFLTSASTIMAVLKIILAILVIALGCKLAGKLTKKIMNSRGMQRLSKTVQTFLGHVIRILLYVTVIIIAAVILGVDLSAFSAVIASVGLTIGLALQGGLSNIAGGVMIVGFKPFEVGDFIETSAVSGTVTDIGIFYTTVTTPDNKRVVIPNGTVSNSIVTNYSSNDTRRLDLVFSISYSTDIDVAKKVLYACAKADERVLSDPAPAVIITEHSDSAVKISLRVWVRTEDYWDVNFDMMEQVKRSFDQFGVDIPFKQLDVHIAK